MINDDVEGVDRMASEREIGSQQATSWTARIPESCSGYRMLGELGRGMSSVVMEAEAQASGEKVAIKWLSPAAPEQIALFRNELRWLSHVEHPHVVSLLDHGVERGLPWVAMQRVEGVPIDVFFSQRQELIATSGRRRRLTEEGLRCWLELALQALDALGYLHEEGIIHRDIKPQNLLIAGERKAYIVDFGFATSVVEQPSASRGAGTAAYMAPEQLRGEVIDPRVDLYSLGCVWYALLAGELPYPSIAEIVQRDCAPAPLSSWIDGVPEPLEALIHKMLAFAPHERPGYAIDVAEQLLALSGVSEQELALPVLRPSHLHETPFVGRDGVLQQVGEAFRRLFASGCGELLLIGGESGIGKTRLAREVAEEAGRHGVRVLKGSCLPPHVPGEHHRSQAQPFAALREPVRQMLLELLVEGDDEAQRIYLKHGYLLGQDDLLGKEWATSRQVGPTPRPGPMAEAEEQALRSQAFLGLLQRFTVRGPCLLVVDDLQWADLATLASVRALHGSFSLDQGPQLLCLGLYRAEEPGPGLEALLALDGLRQLSLPRLSPDDMSQMMLRLLSVEQLPPHVTQQLYQHTEGNPLFLLEYLKVALQQKRLQRRWGQWHSVAMEGASSQQGQSDSPEGFPLELELPGSLQRLIEDRLDGLTSAARELVGRLAVFGREIPLVVLELFPDQELHARELKQRHILVFGPHTAHFSHDKLREVAYESLAPGHRVALHEEIAHMSEALLAEVGLHPVTEDRGQMEATARGAGREETRAQELRSGEPFPLELQRQLVRTLAWHWEQVGRLERATQWYHTAARMALEQLAFHDAEQLFQAALALGPDDTPEALEMQYERSRDGLFYIREHDAAIQALTWLAKHPLSTDGLRIKVLCEIARNHFEQGTKEHIPALLHQARQYEQQFPLERGILLDYEGRLAFENGDFQRATEAMERAIEAFVQSDALSLRLESLRRLGASLWVHGHLHRAQAILEGALADCRLLRHQGQRIRIEGLIAFELANALSRLGLLDEAIQHHHHAIEQFRAVDLALFEGLALTNLGLLSIEQERLTHALSQFSRACDLFASLDRFDDVAYVHVCQAEVFHLLGLFERADRAHRQALEQQTQDEHPVDMPMTLCQMARHARRIHSSLQEGLAHLDAASSFIDPDISPALALHYTCERGHFALARGESAQELVIEAELLGQRAGFGPLSPEGACLRRLQEAHNARLAGETLFRGELLRLLPASLRQALLTT